MQGNLLSAITAIMGSKTEVQGPQTSRERISKTDFQGISKNGGPQPQKRRSKSKTSPNMVKNHPKMPCNGEKIVGIRKFRKSTGSVGSASELLQTTFRCHQSTLSKLRMLASEPWSELVILVGPLISSATSLLQIAVVSKQSTQSVATIQNE